MYRVIQIRPPSPLESRKYVSERERVIRNGLKWSKAAQFKAEPNVLKL